MPTNQMSAREVERRRALTDYEAMLDAQRGCVPCKLCGGAAIISDAGIGRGYYIRCAGSRSFRDASACMIDERRLGGWAYNVMDWWNRLHKADSTADREGWTRCQGEAVKAVNRTRAAYAEIPCRANQLVEEGLGHAADAINLVPYSPPSHAAEPIETCGLAYEVDDGRQAKEVG